MKRIIPYIVACLMIAGSCAAAADKPNIIMILIDDAGYGDFGFQGSPNFKTPHLDQLAKSGVRFTSFYVAGETCAPSRAAVLTGRYQQRFGYEEINVHGIMSENSKLLGDDMGLPTTQKTVADYLHGLGYRTMAIGKWHQGVADRYHPLKRGFDEFYGFRGGARSYFPYRNPKAVSHECLLERGFGNFKEHEGYLTDALAKEACDFMERSKEKPFFIYLAFNAVHTPMEPDPQDKDEFPQFEGKRRIVAQLTLSLDRACGRVMDKVKELGLSENTIIVFTNDNGGPTDENGSANYPLSGIKGTQLEGGMRVPGLISWPGHLTAGSVYDFPVSTLDLLPTFVKLGGGDPAALPGLDGVDLIPFLQGKQTGRPHQTLHWKMEIRGAIREGDWKLLRFPDRPVELFDIVKDPGEQNNLADAYPDLVKQLMRKHFAWELELERPLFMLRRAEEGLSARREDIYRKPPAKDY